MEVVTLWAAAEALAVLCIMQLLLYCLGQHIQLQSAQAAVEHLIEVLQEPQVVIVLLVVQDLQLSPASEVVVVVDGLLRVQQVAHPAELQTVTVLVPRNSQLAHQGGLATSALQLLQLFQVVAVAAQPQQELTVQVAQEAMALEHIQHFYKPPVKVRYHLVRIISQAAEVVAGEAATVQAQAAPLV